MHSNGVEVGTIITTQFDDYLIIPLSKQWLSLNDNNPIEFFVELKKGKLILSGSLHSMDRIKGVDNNVK